MNTSPCPRCGATLSAAIGELPYCVRCRVYVRPGQNAPTEKAVQAAATGKALYFTEPRLAQPVVVPGLEKAERPASERRFALMLLVMGAALTAVVVGAVWLSTL